MGRSFLLAWVAAFLGAPLGDDCLILKDGRILTQLAVEKDGTDYRVRFQNGDIKVPAGMVLDAVLVAAAPVEPKNDDERKALEKGLVKFDGRWMPSKERDALVQRKVADKKKQIDQLKSHQLWRNRLRSTSAHFDFEYTVPPHVFQRYRELLEGYFTEFSKQWKLNVPKEKLKVCFYHDEETYYETSGAQRGAIAYYRFVRPLELNVYYDRLDARGTETTLFHEANHYLSALINPGFLYPHFPGESLAEYYGASSFDAATKKLEFGLLQEGRLAEIQSDIASGRLGDGDSGPTTAGASKPGELMGLEALVSTDRMYEHYTWGWSLCHFLMSDKRYKPKFQAFIVGLAFDREVKRDVTLGDNNRSVSGSEVWLQFKRSLGLKDAKAVAALEKEWHAHVQKSIQTSSARGLQLAAESADHSGRPIRARRLYKEAIEAGCRDANAYHAYARLLVRDNRLGEAITLWKQAIEFDPLQARLYWHLGRSMAKKGDGTEGKRLMSLAREMDPEDPEIDFELDLDALIKKSSSSDTEKTPGEK